MAQIALSANNPVTHAFQDTIELGWTVDATGVNGGDTTQPHIFVYFTNNNYAPNSGCYNVGCGFQPYPNPYVYDGVQLPGNGTLGYFEVFHVGAAWWTYYDGQPFGYFPDALFYGNFVHGLDDLQGFGEVATKLGTPNGDCTQMGNGINAISPSSATINAFEGVKANAALVTSANPGYFGTANYGLNITGVGSAYYGGTGPC